MGDESSPIVRLSTRDVAPADRLSYASWILGSALAPAAVSAETPSQYELDVTALELPSIAIVAQSGSPQRSIRARSEIRRTSQRYFFLALVLSGSWQVAHVTRARLGPGDITFYDSRYPLDCDLLLHWSGLNLQLSEQFVRKWVPNPAVLGWRNICRDSQWGRVLASYVAQLSPEFVVQAPVPQGVLIDQLGALLALTASELSGRRAESAPAERSVRDHVYDHIRQRCADSALQTADVASSLHMSKRSLHRALAACGETFGAMLIQARVDLAVRMLQSPLFDRVTTAEIGRRAGFSDASHFVKVLRSRTGQTPLQMRRASHGTPFAHSSTSAD
ncbi:MAG TPA: helix-turn-helix domain-containing protein [Thermoanaerobaculia bacterium]|nr:helix-turn-helix domain-containing protein [Thermoanaerobaculia bacterium]